MTLILKSTTKYTIIVSLKSYYFIYKFTYLTYARIR